MTTQLSIMGGRMTFDLVEHPMEQQPVGPAQHVGYVRHPGSDVLKVAHWRNGGWLDHKSKPFAEAPACWYSVEPAGHG